MRKFIYTSFAILATSAFTQSLDDLFATALSNSHQAKIDKYTDESATALSDQAIGGTLPQLNFSSGAQYNWISTAPFAEGTNAFQFGEDGPPPLPDYLNSIQYNWNLHMEQTLNVFRLGTVYEGAQRLKKASGLEKELNKETLKMNVAQAYSSVFSTKDQVELNSKLSLSAKAVLQGAEIDFKSGRIPKLQFDLIEANTKVAEAELIISQSKLDAALETLAILTGSKPDIDNLSQPDEEIAKFEGDQNPTGSNIQLQVLDAYLSYNDNLLEYERSTIAPSFALMAGINNQFTHTESLNPDLWDSPSRYTNPDYFNYYVGVKMQWAIYTGGSISAKIRQSEIDNKSQRAQLDKAKEELEVQKKQLNTQAQALKSSLEAAQTAYSTNQSYYDQSAIDHQNGLMAYADLLQSERELKEAAQRLTMSRTGYLMTLIQLQLLNGQSIGAAQ